MQGESRVLMAVMWKMGRVELIGTDRPREPQTMNSAWNMKSQIS